MKRVFYIDNNYGGKTKYVLKKEYENFGVYQEMCPSGFLTHQSYLITDNNKVFVCDSYNNMCYDEMLDTIDYYNETKKFGHKAIKRYDKTNEKHIYIMHPSGTMI